MRDGNDLLRTTQNTFEVFAALNGNGGPVSTQDIYARLQRAVDGDNPPDKVWECTLDDIIKIVDGANQIVHRRSECATDSHLGSSVASAPMGAGEAVARRDDQEDYFPEEVSPPCTDEEEGGIGNLLDVGDLGGASSSSSSSPPQQVAAPTPAPVAMAASQSTATYAPASAAPRANPKVRSKEPTANRSGAKLTWNHRIHLALKGQEDWLKMSEIADLILKRYPEFESANQEKFRSTISAILCKNPHLLWISKPFKTKRGKISTRRLYRARPTLAPYGPRFRNISQLPGVWVQDGTTKAPTTGNHLPYFRTTSPRTPKSVASKRKKNPAAKSRKIVDQQQQQPAEVPKRPTETQKLLADTKSGRDRDEGFASIVSVEQSQAAAYAARHFG